MREYKKTIDKALNVDPQTLQMTLLKGQAINPFSSDISFKEDLFVNREEIIDRILFEIGLGKHKIYAKNIFVTSPTGTGKTSLLKKLYKILNDLSKENKKYHFKKALFRNDLYDEIEGEDEISYLRINQFEDNNYDIVFFIENSGEQILDILKRFQRSTIKVFEVTVIDWKRYNQNFIEISQIFDVIKLEDLSNEHIENSIDLRLKHFNLDKNKLLNEGVIKFLQKSCLNNIGLILSVLNNTFHLILKENREIITLNSIKAIMKYEDIPNLKKKYEQLSSIKKEIISCLYANLNRPMNSKLMSKNINRNWANISGYMKNLSDDNFLLRIKVGKNVEYKLNRLTLYIVESKIMEEI